MARGDAVVEKGGSEALLSARLSKKWRDYALVHHALSLSRNVKELDAYGSLSLEQLYRKGTGFQF